MKLKYLICGMALSVLMFASCSDQMDYHEYKINDKEFIESTFGNVGNFMTHIYRDLDYDLGQMYGGASLCSATDEAVYSHQGNQIESFYNGSWSAVNANSSMWTTCLDGIAYCNMMLTQFNDLKFEDYVLDKYYKGNMIKYKNYQWECRFMRAYFYFLLVRQYGEVPLITESLDADEANNMPKSSVEDIFKFIDDECKIVKDSIIKDYAGAYISLEDENGRVNNLGALALRARAALYHASPLFNTNNDKELWRQAAQRAKECLDTCNVRGMRLAKDYASLFTESSWKDSEAMKEVIFARRNAADNAFERRNFPVGMANGDGGNCPTQNLVDAYEMTNGLPITDPNSGYDANDPYANRDARLAATVAVNGEKWPDALPKDALELWYGGDNSRSVTYGTPTGYYLKKYLNRTTVISGNSATSAYHNWVLFRLGQVYLDYAEAMLNYTGSGYDKADGFNLSAADAINMVRKRAGQPNIATGLDYDAFWNRYQNERFIELAFEGHRFFDVRRWMKGKEYFENIKVMEIIKNDDGTFNYTPVTNPSYITKRTWKGDYMNLFPIPQADILKSGALTQNPGWE